MISLVMAIALWCGNPTQYSEGHITPNQVNQCRQELFQCVEKNQAGTGFLQCFKDKKLK
jgi:hypothetical protein